MTNSWRNSRKPTSPANFGMANSLRPRHPHLIIRKSYFAITAGFTNGFRSASRGDTFPRERTVSLAYALRQRSNRSFPAASGFRGLRQRHFLRRLTLLHSYIDSAPSPPQIQADNESSGRLANTPPRVHTPRSALRTPQSALRTPHSALLGPSSLVTRHFLSGPGHGRRTRRCLCQTER